MDILLPALCIAAIVGFVFYILAAHWQRILRQQSRAMLALTQRVRDLEDVNDPRFRQRLADAAPLPLEQVFTFSFRLTEPFWKNTLGLAHDGWERIQKRGTFVGSVKLERWRSHTVATVLEVLPASQSAQWQKRSLDFYPGERGNDALSLWELPLDRANGVSKRTSFIELLLKDSAIELSATLPGLDAHEKPGTPPEAITVFSVPLDTEELRGFKSRKAVGEPSGANGNGWQVDAVGWQEFYSACDESLGFEWQLGVRDLIRKADWERWKIFDAREG